MAGTDAPSFASRFRLERKLGAGAFGEAHLALDQTTGKRVVVKLMKAQLAGDSEMRERFRREIKALELVRHPSIPALVAHGEDEEKRPFFAVEFCEGSDIFQAMEKAPPPWPFPRILAVMDDIWDGLAAAHAKGVVHRDLKPANVILVKDETGRERAKIIDFGISKHLEGGKQTLIDLTQGRAVGTPLYLSPEQASGDPVDARSDIYSAGVMVYELSTGARPYKGTTANAILKAVLNDAPLPIREKRPFVPEALEKAILRLLAKNRDERPKTALEAKALLHAALGGNGGESAVMTGVLGPLDKTGAMTKDEIAQASDPFIGRTIAGKYELRERLGKGGFGSVYRAWHKELGIDVALKLILLGPNAPGETGDADEAHERFRREARVMRSFTHKHAAQVRDFGRDEDCFYLELDLLKGKTLEQVLAKEGKLDEARTLRLAAQVLSALGEAHKKGIVHRDLKPANIMLVREDGEEQARILDFGISKLVGALEDSSSLRTAEGAAIGTVRYMSPEQAGGDPVGPASDVYSLSVVLYECLTGALPIDAGPEPTQASQRARIMTKPPRPLREVAPFASERTSRAIMAGLEKDPKKRAKDASVFAESLLGGLAAPASSPVVSPEKNEEGIATIAPPRPDFQTRPSGKGVKAVVFLLVLLLLGAIGVVSLVPSAQNAVKSLLSTNGSPDTKSPSTKSPDTRAPSTTAPDTKTPSTSTSTSTSTTSPDTKAPDTKTPGTSTTSPDTKAPDTKVPETRTPEPRLPSWWARASVRPDLPLPKGLTFGEDPATYRNEKDGSVLVFVPAGEFTMGSDRLTEDGPAHKVKLRPFFMGKLEVTWEQYLATGQKTRDPRPEWAGERHPVVGVTWEDADSYCKRAGLRLPTEAEWERAARGAEGRAFPWGEGSKKTDDGSPRLNDKQAGLGKTAPVGNFPQGASPEGCLDMAGNVEEWCSDWYAAYKASPVEDPQGGSSASGWKIVRGGSWHSELALCRSTYRLHLKPEAHNTTLGFRVARSADDR